MSSAIKIRPVEQLCGTIRPPGSKSITNRALVCAALASGPSELTGALDSDDTRVMIDSLTRLGLAVEHEPAAETVRLVGCDGKLPVDHADLFVGNSGTTIRFLTAAVAVSHGRFRLDGVPRMRQRPIGDLIDALRSLGANIETEAAVDCPPVVIHANGLRGGVSSIRGDVSSQFLSGLLLAAPYAEHPVTLELVGELVSVPYVTMTVEVMRAFGGKVAWHDARLAIDNSHRYSGQTYAIEPDASAASYFWGAAAITGGAVLVEGLSATSLQGDVAFTDCLRQMGCDVEHLPQGIRVTGRPMHGIDVNMNAISDTVQTLAAVALFASGPTTIRGVGHIRHKETDRIGDLARELRKLGARVDESDDGLTITPATLHGCEIDTYDDHRMAMSLSLVGLRIPDVVIRDPDCTAKTYPGFWEDMRSLV